MDRLMTILAIFLVATSLLALGWFGWVGNWGAIGIAFALVVAGPFILGLAELILSPLVFALGAFAKRGWSVAAGISCFVFALLQRLGFAIFCSGVMLSLLREAGPPAWVVVVLSVFLASGPFGWAVGQAERHGKDATMESLDFIAALIGTGLVGVLWILSVPFPLLLMPIFFLFTCTSLFCVYLFFATKYHSLVLEGAISSVQKHIARKMHEEMQTRLK